MHVVLVDLAETRLHLLPLVYFSPIARLRVGVGTLEGKWSGKVRSISLLPAPYLRSLFPFREHQQMVFVHAGVIPTDHFVAHLAAMPPHSTLYDEKKCWLASKGAGTLAASCNLDVLKKSCPKIAPAYTAPLHCIDRLWKILQYNEEKLSAELCAMVDMRVDGEVFYPDKKAASDCFLVGHPSNRAYGAHPIHLAGDAFIYGSTFSTREGPIYLGRGVQVEDAFLQGPCMVDDNAQIVSATVSRSVLGVHAKVGGEVLRSVIFDYSNKAHHGFLGDSIIGRWCNIGAGTSASNLKNTYATVSLWDYAQSAYVDTHRQFCGLFMGDYSKCGIHTMFNTGTVVGASANLFGYGLLLRHVPSFFWGGCETQAEFALPKAIEVAQRTMLRRKKNLPQAMQALFSLIFEETAQYRIPPSK